MLGDEPVLSGLINHAMRLLAAVPTTGLLST